MMERVEQGFWRVEQRERHPFYTPLKSPLTVSKRLNLADAPVTLGIAVRPTRALEREEQPWTMQ